MLVVAAKFAANAMAGPLCGSSASSISIQLWVCVVILDNTYQCCYYIQHERRINAQ